MLSFIQKSSGWREYGNGFLDPDDTGISRLQRRQRAKIAARHIEKCCAIVSLSFERLTANKKRKSCPWIFKNNLVKCMLCSS